MHMLNVQIVDVHPDRTGGVEADFICILDGRPVLAKVRRRLICHRLQYLP